MAPRYVSIDRNTPLLLPPDLRDWLPEDHLAHFVVEALDTLAMEGARVNERGTGDAQYPPRMMLGLLCYAYATGVFSSRQIERATYTDVAMRYLSGDTHPDHDTLCTFRRRNGALLEQAFVGVLRLAQEMKFLKVGRIAVDGTKVAANASKHSAVSYKRAGEKIEQLEMEVAQLLRKAEEADRIPLEDGLSVPGEIARRQDRIGRLEAARAAIEQRAKERAQRERVRRDAKRVERAERRARGERVGGREPQEPRETPEPSDQHNFTDPQSRIMKAGSGDHFEQAYNAQAAVDIDSRLIVAQRVSDQPNDKEQLAPTVKALPKEVGGDLREVLADSGFASEAAIREVECDGGPTVLAAVERTSHHRTVEDLERREDPPEPPPEAPRLERMRWRLRTRAGKALYKLRQQTVEPVFGIVKEVMGFRRFRLRGLARVNVEWTWVCLAYNLKRLHRLQRAVA